MQCNKHAADNVSYVQRNQRNASTNYNTPHTAIMSNSGQCAHSGSPSVITACSASFSAVSGSSLMSGCTMSGKCFDEKNTPDTMYIGSMTRFISPETASIVLARQATS